MAAPSKRELNATRKAHRAEVDLAVKSRIKGLGWRQNQGVAFREIGGLVVKASYHATSPDVYSDYQFDGACKPMTLDPLMWDVLEIEGNEKQPLSFRVFGAFTTQALRLLGESAPGKDPATVAETFGQFLAKLEVYTLASWPSFADFVAKTRTAEGSHPPEYFETHVLALLAEDRLPEARAVAKIGLAKNYSQKYSYLAGEEPGKRKHKSRSFAEMAKFWIDQGKRRSL